MRQIPTLEDNIGRREHTIAGEIRGHKKKRGDRSPLFFSRERKRLPGVLPFYRVKPDRGESR
jgi:hypothetical protein